jgi:hypothetical protein
MSQDRGCGQPNVPNPDYTDPHDRFVPLSIARQPRAPQRGAERGRPIERPRCLPPWYGYVLAGSVTTMSQPLLLSGGWKFVDLVW